MSTVGSLDSESVLAKAKGIVLASLAGLAVEEPVLVSWSPKTESGAAAASRRDASVMASSDSIATSSLLSCSSV